MSGYYSVHKEFAGKTVDELHLMLDNEITIAKELTKKETANKELIKKILEEMNGRG